MNETKQKNWRNVFTRRKAAGAVSLVLAVLLLLGGTFAWDYYADHKTNDADVKGKNYKARLVEDYDKTKAKNWNLKDPTVTKKISVYNPGAETEQDTSVYGDIYTRIQLKEFMEFYKVSEEYYPDRYMIGTDGKFLSFETEEKAKDYVFEIEEKYKLEEHKVEQKRIFYTPTKAEDPVNGVDDKDLPWYIQTREGDPNGVYGAFMLKDSKTADKTNGRPLVTGVSRADEAQKKATAGHHDDYINTAGDVQTTQPHANGECDYTVHKWEDAEDGRKDKFYPNGAGNESFFEYIKWHFGDDVLLYDDWDGETQNKWIIDTKSDEGWVYWLNPIAPNKMTSDFLTNLELLFQPEDAFYYALHVDMQAVSYNELDNWLENNDKHGNTSIVNALKNALRVVVTGPKYISLSANGTPFNADKDDVVWSIEDLNGNNTLRGITINSVSGFVDVDGLAERIGTKFIIRATKNDSITGTIQVEVALPIIEKYFPDETFMEIIKKGDKFGNVFDKNGDEFLTKTEIEQITKINGSLLPTDTKGSVEKLNGIEYFYNLKELDFRNHSIESVDVTKNKELIVLGLVENNLKSINVKNNTKLKTLSLARNKIEGNLNLESNIDLEYAYLQENKIEKILLGEGTKMKILNVTKNNLKELDVSKETSLQQLSCSTNHLTQIKTGGRNIPAFIYSGQTDATGKAITPTIS